MIMQSLVNMIIDCIEFSVKKQGKKDVNGLSLWKIEKISGPFKKQQHDRLKLTNQQIYM